MNQNKKSGMTAEKLYEGIGYMDDKWLSLLDESTVKVKKNRRFVGYELKKLLG